MVGEVSQAIAEGFNLIEADTYCRVKTNNQTVGASAKLRGARHKNEKLQGSVFKSLPFFLTL